MECELCGAVCMQNRDTHLMLSHFDFYGLFPSFQFHFSTIFGCAIKSKQNGDQGKKTQLNRTRPNQKTRIKQHRLGSVWISFNNRIDIPLNEHIVCAVP